MLEESKLAAKMQEQFTRLRDELVDDFDRIESELISDLKTTRGELLEVIAPLAASEDTRPEPGPQPSPEPTPKPAPKPNWLAFILLSAVIGFGIGWYTYPGPIPNPNPIPNPIPQPIPDPQPQPQPQPDPTPVVTYPGAWVLIIEETEEIDVDWAIMKADAAYWDGLKTRGLNWRFYDDDAVDAKPYVSKSQSVGIPAVVILSATGRVLAVEKRPASNDALDAIVRRATGL